MNKPHHQRMSPEHKANKGTYVCIWSEGTVGASNEAPLIEVHDLSFFTEDSGYDMASIRAVVRLLSEETVNLSQMFQAHVVVCTMEPDDEYAWQHLCDVDPASASE